MQRSGQAVVRCRRGCEPVEGGCAIDGRSLQPGELGVEQLNAIPRVLVLCLARDDADALEDIDNVINAASFDAKPVRSVIEANVALAYTAVDLDESASATFRLHRLCTDAGAKIGRISHETRRLRRGCVVSTREHAKMREAVCLGARIS
jgi:hypothetical protein